MYFIVAIIAAGYFSAFSPLMVLQWLGSYVNHTHHHNINMKNSRWMYYVSTLPVKRNDYIKSYFAFYLILLVQV
ncbi:ABC-2 transporter permease [Staphylococcus aureus]